MFAFYFFYFMIFMDESRFFGVRVEKVIQHSIILSVKYTQIKGLIQWESKVE